MTYDKNKIFNLLKNYHFPKDFYNENVLDLLYELPDDNIYCEYGASKVTIISKHFKDFVIKIPFTGDKEMKKERFKYANSNLQHYYKNNKNLSCWDYCHTDVEIYNLAKEKNIEKYFAEIKLLGYCDKHPIYIQEKCKIFTEKELNSIETEKIKRLKEKLNSSSAEYSSSAWLLEFSNRYGENELKKLTNFLDSFDISDLHKDNLGYNKKGEMVLIDYSGFND